MTLDDFPPRQTKQAHYPIAFRLEAVRRVEADEVQRVVAAAMGIAPITLIEWLRRHGTAAYALLKRKVYTPAQKHAIVRALRTGLLTEADALLKYGLREKKTLRLWVAAQVATVSRPATAIQVEGTTRLAFYRQRCLSPAFSPVGDTGHC